MMYMETESARSVQETGVLRLRQKHLESAVTGLRILELTIILRYL